MLEHIKVSKSRKGFRPLFIFMTLYRPDPDLQCGIIYSEKQALAEKEGGIMAKGKLSYDEICELSENSNVVSVSENRITYTEEFKLHFMEEYMLEKGAISICL